LRTAVHDLRTVVIQSIPVEEKHQQLVLLLRALLAMDLKENAALFLSAFFPYACPEPVLVKRSFLA
jgi:hypothetical protein